MVPEEDTVSTEENKAFVRRYFDAINGKEKPAAISTCGHVTTVCWMGTNRE
jgi:hypothetical protein